MSESNSDLELSSQATHLPDCTIYPKQSDKSEERFLKRNDLFIYVDNEMFFGESTHPSLQIPPTRPLRLSNWSQRHLGESVLMYEHNCQNFSDPQI
jgi:hypothetical protein